MTEAITSRWSPAGTRRATEHSSAASPSDGISAPDREPRSCGTSSSASRALGRPSAANRPASIFCAADSSVTANRAAGSDGLLSTSAG
jgi:hypothetical protein